MQQVYIEEINTTLQPMQIYKLISVLEYSFFLDSAMDPEHLGRYSFIGAEPFLRLSSKGNNTEVWEKGQQIVLNGNPFEVLSSYLRKYPIENNSAFPFIGGAVGYLSYDLCRLLENIPSSAVDDPAFPDMMMGFYNGIIMIDHAEKKTYAIALACEGDEEETGAARVMKWKKFVENEVMPDETGWDDPFVYNIEQLQSNFTEDAYCSAIEKVRHYIFEGDIYQANISQCFSMKIRQHPLHIYERLRSINPAPFAAYLDYETTHILSSSPERFMKVREGIVETRPIKGTMPRGADAKEDLANRNILMHSEKDMAENLMIVDLMRNDLGKVCTIGSVRVPELFTIETYPTVFHMVSFVTGVLRDGCDAVDCITATFPGGSITGAPKVRAMEIIEEIEPSRRLIYTGSIGYIGFDGTMDMNIAIRTILIRGDLATYQVGGGIVWDSVPGQEYQETLDKGAALRKTLLSEDGVK
jgi:para-aminobenzoate synthetase component 1